MASLFWSDPHPPPPKVGSSAAKKWMPSAKLMSKSFRQKLRFGGGQFFCHANLVSYSCEQQSATDKRSLPTKCKSTTSKWYHTLFSFARQKYRVGKGWFEYTTKHYKGYCVLRYEYISDQQNYTITAGETNGYAHLLQDIQGVYSGVPYRVQPAQHPQ